MKIIKMRTKRVSITAFVDWNSQRHECRELHHDPTGLQTLELIVRKIEKLIGPHAKRSELYEITIRAYCGWHKGFQPTPLRQELAGISDEVLHTIGKQPNMPVRILEFGDVSLGAMSKRISPGTSSHFPATCREQEKGKYAEKMVDTALTSDLVYSASQADNSWLIVVGEDIDLVPGVYTAETLLQSTNRKIALLRRGSEKYLEINDLCRIQ